MKERPVLFSGPMVRAILEGRKTQTRRVIKKIPCECGKFSPVEMSATTVEGWQTEVHSNLWWCDCCAVEPAINCPYGVPGTKLWVRESFRLSDTYRDCACYEPCSCKNGVPIYAADFSNDPEMGPFKPSIHMPRWASRITLEVTGVRVERLQDISEEDAKAEGIEREFAHGRDIGWKNYLWHGHFGEYGLGNSKSDAWPHQYSTYENARGCFSSLWHLINAGRGFGWDTNPWVWVVEFKRIEG